MHGDEAERIREERAGGCVGFCGRSAVAGRLPYRREDECGIMMTRLNEEKARMCNLDILVNHLKTAKELY